MSKQHTPAPAKEENKKTSKQEDKQEGKKQAAAPPPPQDDITQPNPNDEDTQGYIKENARKGESTHVPNSIGNDAVSTPLDSEK